MTITPIILARILVCAAAIGSTTILNQSCSERRPWTRSDVAQAEVDELAKQVALYCVDNGLLRPDPKMTLSALTNGSSPYLRPEDLVDPWGRSYQLVIPGKTNPDFDVVSYGADGAPGGSGEDVDVVNR